MRSEYGEVKRYLLNIISHHILRALVRLIDCVVHLLSSKPPVAQSLRAPVSHRSYLGGDLLFVLRVVAQCTLPDTPLELSAEAETLGEKATSPFPSSGGANGGMLEKCPACGVEIPLADTASALCSNGHRWCEVSITSDACPIVLMAPLSRQLAALSHRSFWREPWCAPASAARGRPFFLPRDLYTDRKEEGM
jgi:general transcription factor 3C protein 4